MRSSGVVYLWVDNEDTSRGSKVGRFGSGTKWRLLVLGESIEIHTESTVIP